MTGHASRRLRLPPSSPRRAVQGFALLGSLVATIILGLGASAAIRWSAVLMGHDRDQQVRFHALQRLHNALETGQPDNDGTSGPAGEDGATLPGGATVQLEITDRPPGLGGEPAAGRHRRLMAHWTDAKGVSRRLVVHTFWYPSPRTY